MDNLEKELPSKIKALLPYWVIVSVALIIASICCLSIQTTTTHKDCTNLSRYEYEHIVKYDYRNCTDDNSDTCYSQTPNPCFCKELLIIPRDVIGDVVIFYRLDDFNETDIAKQPGFFQSRDDNQLRGLLNDTPSEACQPYAYDETNKPILPCGAIADAMFTDQITLHRAIGESVYYVPMLEYGTLREKDKEGFQNPVNFSTEFRNFSKPKSWSKNLWELDTKNEENNGLRNEAFIAWMHTDWPEKPLWRLNRSSDEAGGFYRAGLPAGNYTLTVDFSYPFSRYNGRRTLIVKREYSVSEPWCSEAVVTTQKDVGYRVGVVGLILGILFLLIGGAVAISFFVTKRRSHAKSPVRSEPPNIQITTSDKTTEIGNSSPKVDMKEDDTLLLHEATKPVENSE